MRYIDTQDLYSKAATWGHSEELWKNPTLQNDFRQCFFNKCWYTETLLAGSDKPIDHFRPKGEIKPFEQFHFNRPLGCCGYEWLKNEYKNYRVCCEYANRKTGDGGKGCFFPLCDDTYLTPTGTEDEKPMLLDPLIKDDVKLLSFFKKDIQCTSLIPLDCKRVEVSKKIYNLTHPDFEQPRITIWESVERYLKQYDRNNDVESLVENLKTLISQNSIFSACAISAVKSMVVDEAILNRLDLEL